MKYSHFLVIGLMVLGSCAPKLSFTWTKPGYDGAKYNKIAIFTSGKNLQSATEFQDYMVEYLGQQGFNAVSGMSILNPVQMKDLKPEDIQRILLKEGVDAVISAVVIDKDKSLNYNQGSSSYGYYGGYGGYYGYRGGGYYDQGYYSETTTYLLENHFYEVNEGGDKEEALIWASQSEVSDPTKNTRKVYAKVLIQGLVDDGIIK
ncbi:MAG: hypothetical protein OCD76_18955 [Reichenbachiella sp.]